MGGFLDELADRVPDPAAGAAAAVTVASAAALVAMAARFTQGELGGWATRADRLRAEALKCADQDGEAYRRVLEARRLPRDSADRSEQVASALRAATEVPLQIAETAATVTEMATRLADEGNRNLVGDVETAALLAAGATHAVHRMVRANVSLGSLDHELLQRARLLLDRTEQALTTRAERTCQPT